MLEFLVLAVHGRAVSPRHRDCVFWLLSYLPTARARVRRVHAGPHQHNCFSTSAQADHIAIDDCMLLPYKQAHGAFGHVSRQDLPSLCEVILKHALKFSEWQRSVAVQAAQDPASAAAQAHDRIVTCTRRASTRAAVFMGVLQVLSQSPHSVSRWMPSGTGRHGLDERPNAIGTEQAGKMRPRFVDRVCPAIPGRALPTVVNLATADGTVRGVRHCTTAPRARRRLRWFRKPNVSTMPTEVRPRSIGQVAAAAREVERST